MAWRKAKTLERLIVTTYDSTDISLDNFIGASTTSQEELGMCSNPWDWTGGTSDYEGVAGSLDLNTMGLATPVGNYFYVWRTGANGRNVHIRFTRNRSDRLLIQMCVYGSLSGGLELLIDAGSPGLQRPVYAGFGFLCDADNGLGSIYWCRGWTTAYGSVRRYAYTGFGGNQSMFSMGCYSLISGQEIDPPTPGGDNPYAGGGLNDEAAGGEDQNFEETSDTIAEPTLPSSPATGSGFITAYVPTLSEINDVADYLIDPSILQALAGTVLKLSDVVIGLSIFPFTITATGSKEIKMNLCGVHLTTGVTCHYSDSQFVSLNMGTLEVKKYWDNCLDYDPYTRITLYLPYVGFVDLDTDEVMGKDVTVKYNVDIVTGCCLALIIVDDSVLYQYPGECSCQVPITSVSFDTFLQSAVQLGITAASGARAVKGAGASLAEAGGHVLATDDAGVQRLAMGDYDKERAKFTGIKASVTDSLISASVGAVLSAKGQYSHAGAMSSCAGILGTQKPFLIIKRPKQCMPEGFESIRGFPCNMKATLSDLEGYTEVGDIHLNIPNATVQEIVECEQFLKEGVFL